MGKGSLETANTVVLSQTSKSVGDKEEFSEGSCLGIFRRADFFRAEMATINSPV